jgi:hypothetical protein
MKKAKKTLAIMAVAGRPVIMMENKLTREGSE